MKKNKTIVVSENMQKAAVVINEMMTHRDMKTVKDNYICYGTTTPLCGNTLGKKGLIKDERFITCPECKRLIK